MKKYPFVETFPSQWSDCFLHNRLFSVPLVFLFFNLLSSRFLLFSLIFKIFLFFFFFLLFLFFLLFIFFTSLFRKITERNFLNFVNSLRYSSERLSQWSPSSSKCVRSKNLLPRENKLCIGKDRDEGKDMRTTEENVSKKTRKKKQNRKEN